MLRHPSLIPLSHEHHHGLALCVLVGRALSKDSSLASVSAQARSIVAHFERELRSHFDTEEQILFPTLSRFPELQEMVTALIEEHRRMERIVNQLRNANDPVLVREFVSVIRKHIRQEESQLFQGAQQMLSEDELEHLARAIKNRNG